MTFYTQAIRIPSNTNPHYGSISADGAESRSFRDVVGSFAGSYSRASLSIAENLIVHDSNDDAGEHNKNYLVQTLSNRSIASTQFFPPLSRHTTIASVLSYQFGAEDLEQSTFVQSVFNSINLLVGIGILALPLAFRYAGWVMGSVIFFFCVFTTNYTAKILGKCLDFRPGLCTYGDMGEIAFGERGRALIGGIFMVELVAIGVTLIILLGDGIQSLFGRFNAFTIGLMLFAILTPTLFFPIRRLVFTSVIGIVTCISLVIIVLYDGFTKIEHPGSLWEPMETELIPSDIANFPLSFGLMMAGFTGHSVFPAIYRDMKDPKEYNQMINITYVLTVFLYCTMAGAGYLMFGLDTMQEVINDFSLDNDTKVNMTDYTKFGPYPWVQQMVEPLSCLANSIDAYCKIWAYDEALVSELGILVPWKTFS
ncbi:hypothetical protein DFQ29_003506 [Apophysomyces sp. BC1021]|nr:hypothetical protein DFQ29_003506 [Apophysomyces sp. BC1021]